MKGFEKYEKQFFPAKNVQTDWMNKTYIDKAPIWCSVDLRDGNQALITPMKKLRSVFLRQVRQNIRSAVR